MTPDEEATLAIRFFTYVCAAAGMQKPELRDWLLAELRDGPAGLLELADEGVLIISTKVDDDGTHLCAHLRDPESGAAAPLTETDARNLGVSDETVAEWGQIAAESGNVTVTIPDHPEEDA